ncbi:hypothetical protein EVA_06672 [gut metagenome]|uniref:Uncharacterized protein n=1 Tax=gut metagenome TaxID=749906 RepID=J9GX09_9ZZZZ
MRLPVQGLELRLSFRKGFRIASYICFLYCSLLSFRSFQTCVQVRLYQQHELWEYIFRQEARQQSLCKLFPFIESIGETRNSHPFPRGRYSSSHKRSRHSRRYSHYHRTAHLPIAYLVSLIQTSNDFRNRAW